MADITRAELAAQLGVSERALRRHLERIPGLTCLRLGRKVWFDPDQVRIIRLAIFPDSVEPDPEPAFEDMPRLAEEQKIPRYWDRLFARAKRGAIVRGIPYELKALDALCIINRANGRCEVSGLFFDRAPVGHKGWMPYAPSVDRIDSSIGYSAANTRLVSCAVNLALGSWGDEVLLNIARGVVLMNEKVALQ